MEIHTVTTEDGYILEMHRIPGSVNEPAGQTDSEGRKIKKKAVFLQHGIFATDFVWASGPNNSSLGLFDIVTHSTFFECLINVWYYFNSLYSGRSRLRCLDGQFQR